MTEVDLSQTQALTGAFTFTADLTRAIIPLPRGMNIDFFTASSYGLKGTVSGDVKLSMGGKLPVTGRHVLVVGRVSAFATFICGHRPGVSSSCSLSVTAASVLSTLQPRLRAMLSYLGHGLGVSSSCSYLVTAASDLSSIL